MQSAENESVYRAAKKPEEANATNVGGQALIEGVMMRAPGALTMVCRRLSNGELVVRERTMPTVTSGPLTWPLIRGAGVLVSSLRIGQQALRWSAEIQANDIEALERKEAAMKDGALDPNETSAKVAKAEIASPPTLSVLTTAMSAMGQTVLSIVSTTGTEEPVATDEKSGFGRVLAIVPIVMAIGLFVAAPQAAAEGINALLKLGLEVTSPGYQAITGAAKLCIVVGYMALLRLIPDIRRVFQYHGAEHKAISTLEAGHDLTVEAARPTSPLHARCGTTFLVMVAMVSVVLFSAVGAILPPLPGGRLVQSLGFFLMKLPLLPVVAGITYEIQRFMAKYCTTGPLQVLIWPGFLVQKITTAPPNDDQLEVALASLRTALARSAEKAPAVATPADRTYESYGALAGAVPVDATAPAAA